MKKIFVFLFLTVFLAPLFSFELSSLVKQIITAEPEEMLALVLNQSYKKDLQEICRQLEEQDSDDIIEALKNAFPGITDDETMFIALKLGLVCTLGSGDRAYLNTALEIVEFCEQVESMTGMAEMPEALLTLTGSKYWKDCLAFLKLIDIDSLLMERFPEEF